MAGWGWAGGRSSLILQYQNPSLLRSHVSQRAQEKGYWLRSSRWCNDSAKVAG